MSIIPTAASLIASAALAAPISAPIAGIAADPIIGVETAGEIISRIGISDAPIAIRISDPIETIGIIPIDGIAASGISIDGSIAGIEGVIS